MGGMGLASYLGLVASGELERRAEVLDDLLTECAICPHQCRVDRRTAFGKCVSGRRGIVASWTPHFGEEPVISGDHGSGTVFLANCNLRCVFCQNHQISQRPKAFIDKGISDHSLAGIFLDLQRRGCHNINWVSPTHQVPQLVRALLLAAQRGLQLPVVYNSNGYDSVEVLRLLDGVVDVYLPDLKFADAETAVVYSRVPDYPEKARAAVKEMFRQTGDCWQMDRSPVLNRGLLVRILVLPNSLADVAESLQWIARDLSPKVRVSLMAQYHPEHFAAKPGRYPLLARTISAGEWARALEALERTMKGDGHFIQDHLTAPGNYRPDFNRLEAPFS